MFALGSSEAGLALTLWCLVGWGLWPFLRTQCGASVPAFALLNITSQMAAAAVWGLTLGTLVEPDGGPSFPMELERLFRSGLDLRDGAVFLGGFCIGHGDHISALAMQHLPGGVVYPIYAGFIVIGGGLLNYVQVQPANPPLLFVGFVLILCAIGLLALAEQQHRHGEERDKMSTQEEIARAEGYISFDAEDRHAEDAAATGGASNGPGVSVRSISGSSSGSMIVPGSLSAQLTPPADGAGSPRRLSFRQALVVTLAGATCGCMWSPLATFGTGGGGDNVEANPYVCLFVFAAGQLCALPSVAIIASRIAGTGVFALCWNLSGRAVIWGSLCGLSVSSAFLAFFLGEEAASATAVFGIGHCNPLVALLIEVCCIGSFRGATAKVRACLALCVCLYCMAVGVLMMSNG